MNKHPFEIVFKLTVLVLLIVLLFLQFKPEKKIVYVDTQKLVAGYKGMQEARKEFEIKTAELKAKLDTLHREAEQLIKQHEQTAAKLSTKDRAALEQQIERRQKQYMDYQQVVSEKIKQEDQQLSSKVLAKVNDFIKKYGNEKGYSIIMAATAYGNIVYTTDEVDVTQEVLEGLNREYGQ